MNTQAAARHDVVVKMLCNLHGLYCHRVSRERVSLYFALMAVQS